MTSFPTHSGDLGPLGLSTPPFGTDARSAFLHSLQPKSSGQYPRALDASSWSFECSSYAPDNTVRGSQLEIPQESVSLFGGKFYCGESLKANWLFYLEKPWSYHP